MQIEYWKGKKVLITGGNGFIGSNIVHQLVEFKSEVICLIRDDIANSPLKDLKENNKITIVQGTVTDFEFVTRVISEYEPEFIFHLAAQPIVTIANKNPVPTLKTNIEGTWNILEASRQNGGTHKIVIASTDKAYGIHENLPYDETYALQGRYPYDVSKSCADLIAQMFYATYKMPIAITRCSNIYGPNDLNFNRIIPESIKAILQDKDPEIRSNGLFKRQYMYVKDGVNAYLTLAENMERPEILGQAFNFGTGDIIDVITLTNKIIEVSKKTNLKPKILNTAKNEIPDQYLDTKKAQKMLNWQPKYDLIQGLAETYKWYKEHFEKKGFF